MLPVIKMQAKTFIRNPSLVFTILFPFIMTAILGSVMTSINGSGDDSVLMMQVMMNIIVISTMSAITNNFGSNFMDLKKSIIIKRLGSTKIKKHEALFGFMIWTIMLNTVVILYIILLTTIFSIPGHFWLADGLAWYSVDWLGFIYGVLMLMIISFTISFLFISIAPSTEIYSLMSFFYFFLVMYFGGLIFPGVSIIWMNIASLFLPHTYIAHFLSGTTSGGEYMNSMTHVSTGISIWSLGAWSDADVKAGTSSLNLVMPIILAFFTGFYGIKNFKWD